MVRQRPYRSHMAYMAPAAAAWVDTKTAAMATVTDPKNTGYNRSGNTYNGGNNNSMYGNPYGSRGFAGQGYGMSHNPAADLAALTHGFQGMSLQNPTFAAQAKNAMMSSAANNYGGLSVATSMPTSMYGNTAQYVYPNAYGVGNNAQAANMYTPNAQHYMGPVSYPTYQQDNSPLSQQHWTPTTGTTGDVPTLITPRRDSVSSNENDQPPTPSYMGYPSFQTGGVAINRSPSGVFTHSTPSPTSMVGPYGMAMGKQPEHSDVSPTIKMLVSKEPVIPRAIPAPSSPLKALDRALENQRGETNVYIRGLLPETSDEVLEQWGSRFGDIKSHKSIIDHNTGLCKGFGFIKYYNYEDAENCIRGFHYLGYEVSFARESFYSKLKAFSDEHNTNLYVSNLPKSMNEHQLAQLFEPHQVCSARILRNQKDGQGRGVGFARFDSRDTCDEVIKTFNNHTIKADGEELQIQIRFADTQEQKSLKQQTQAARQFRSAEYEYATQQWRQGRLPHAGTTDHATTNSNEFDQYLGTTPNVPIQNQRWTQYGGRSLPGRSPLGGLPSNTAQTPLVQINVASANDAGHTAASVDVETKAPVTSPATVQATSPVDSGTASEQE